MSLVEKISANYSKKTNELNKMIGEFNTNIVDMKFYKLDDSKDIVDVLNKETGNMIMRCEYKIVGYYNVTMSSWTWVWDNPFIEKNMRIDKELFMRMKPTILEQKSQSEKEEFLYYIENASYYISLANVERLIKFIMYVLDASTVLYNKNEHNSSTVLEMIVITKILQAK